MHVNPINHDYDEANRKPINWEEHTGLADRTARIMVIYNERLEPYRDDITCDLWEVLWRCAQSYDKDIARFSTYACRSMIRKYNHMCMLYLGYSPRNKLKHRNTVSLSTKVGETSELIHMIPADEGPDIEHASDLAYAFEIVSEIAGKGRMDIMYDHANGNGDRHVARSARRMTKRLIDEVRDEDPELIAEIELVLGVVA